MTGQKAEMSEPDLTWMPSSVGTLFSSGRNKLVGSNVCLWRLERFLSSHRYLLSWIHVIGYQKLLESGKRRQRDGVARWNSHVIQGSRACDFQCEEAIRTSAIPVEVSRLMKATFTRKLRNCCFFVFVSRASPCQCVALQLCVVLVAMWDEQRPFRRQLLFQNWHGGVVWNDNVHPMERTFASCVPRRAHRHRSDRHTAEPCAFRTTCLPSRPVEERASAYRC